MSIEIKRQTERQRTRESGPTRKSPIPACDGTLGRRSELAGCICVCFSPLTPALPAPLRTKPPFPPVRPILTRTKTPCGPLMQHRWAKHSKPWQVAGVAVIFSSAQSAYFSGAVIPIGIHAVGRKIVIPCFPVQV